MAAANLDIIVQLAGNAERDVASLSDKIGGLGKTALGVGSTVTKAIGGIALGGAIAGIGGLGAALVSGIGDAREAAKVFAQSEAVIKSTGGAAGVTAQQVADFSASLSAAAGKSLFGDDQIAQSENLLLTFTNLKGGVLEAATAISVDMAQALGGAPADAAVQLGKALNDPINGISALTRVGVTFSDQQKEQIKTMVEAGDVAGAQGVILAELNKEFGGSAAAAAAADGGFTQFKDSMGELAESVGTMVLPMLNQLMAWLNSPDIQAGIQSIVTGLVDGVGAAFTWLTSTAIPALITGWQLIQPALAAVGEVITGTVLPVLQSLIAWFQGDGTAAVSAYVGFFTGVWTQIQSVVSTVLPAIQSIIQTVFGVIATFIEENGGTIVTVLQTAWSTVQSLISVAVDTIGTIVTTVFGVVADFLAENSDSIQNILSTAWDTIATIIEGATLVVQNIVIPTFRAIASFISDHAAEIQAILQTAWNLVSTIVTTALNVIQGVVRTVMALIKGDWSGAWDEIKATAQTLWDGIKSVVEIAINAVKGVIDAVMPTIQSTLETAWNTVKTTVATAWEEMRSTVATKIGEIVGEAQAIPGKITGALATLAGSLLQIGKDAIQGLINGLKSLDVGSILGGFIRGAIDTAKGFIKSQSPSKVTRDELGKPMGQGIVGGVLDTANALKSALGKTIIGAIQVAAMETVAFAGEFGGDLGKAIMDGITEEFKIPEDNVKQIFGGKLRGLVDEAAAAGEEAGAAIVAGISRQLEKFDFGKIDMIFSPGANHQDTNRPTKGERRAIGGPVYSGSSYIVGERGPERFVPRVSGTIIPNNAIGGNTYNTITVIAQPGEDTRTLAVRVAEEIDRRNRLARMR